MALVGSGWSSALGLGGAGNLGGGYSHRLPLCCACCALQAIVFLGGVAGPLSADQLNGTATALEGLTGLPWGSVEQSDSLAQLLSLDLFPKSLPTGKGTYVYA